MGLSLSATARTDDLKPEERAFFEAKVRPVLAENCYSCHSEAAGKHKGGLLVDSRAGLLEGGDSGPAIEPGDPENSVLIEAIGYEDPFFQMPPKGKLPPDQIEALTRWVRIGAPWPDEGGSGTTRARTSAGISDEDRQWWAFQPVRDPVPPDAGGTWARNPIDRFIARRHQAAGLKPAPEADRAVLIRRLTYDLWGLPPTPEEIDAFVADPSSDAYERLVERLLASPRYGERWARHWLDLVRYADSDGYRADEYRPHAWRYRDYVVRSLNEDKPYDRFVLEQIAGDELFPGDPEALIATGYLRHWIYEYNNRDVRGQWSIILNDITDTTADVFLGLGVQCARCHDHKFDPILQRDYFRLQAFFANMLPRDDLVAATDRQQAEYAEALRNWEDATASIRAEIAAVEAPYREKAAQGAITKFPEDIQAMILKPVVERTPLEHQLAELAYRQVTYEYDRLDRALKGEDKERVLALNRQLAQFDRLKPAPLPVAFAVTDAGPVAPPITIPKRGSDPVEPGFLTILDPEPARIEPPSSGLATTGRRAALARWLASPDNPLTARVIVNRVWQQHFGKGLAANASDFGKLGEQPSHPELLDWLARHFVEHGWSLKSLHRWIVTSATYRQSSTHPEPSAGLLADPENRWLWRAPVRRLDAEQIRDALFAVSGELDPTPNGAPTAATQPRRSIFTKVLRNQRDPLLDVFDAPLWFASASSRDTTTTPVQSLLLINSQPMLQRARAFAERLARDSDDGTRRIERAYRLALGRSPAAAELTAVQEFLDQQARRIDLREAGSAQAAFLTGKIPYRDGQAADITLDSATHRLPVPHASSMPRADFTIEAFVLARSVDDGGAVRTIAAKWTGDRRQPGWAFGITGKQSRRKPQTVVLQMIGDKADGTVGEEAVFSDHTLQLNKPYYLAASVRLATTTQPGAVRFFLKDLSNDDEPLLVTEVPHQVTGGLENDRPLTLGGRSGQSEAPFDGLIDDVRLSAAALSVDQLLYTREGANSHTVGYWIFESRPDVFHDASGKGRDIRPGPVSATAPADRRQAAWIDFCHVLMNSSEFLYVE
jgi:hypothetical protein